jgi:hypothetical protein
MVKKKVNYVTICPKCGSKDVSADFSNPAAVATGLFQNFKKCHHCGHTAMMFPEVPESQVPKKPKNVKMIKEKTLVNTTYGRGVTGFWKYTGPLGIVVSLIIFLYYNAPLNIIGIGYGFPITAYLTFFAYRRKLVQKSPFLRVFSAFIVLYAFFGPFLWLMLLAR